MGVEWRRPGQGLGRGKEKEMTREGPTCLMTGGQTGRVWCSSQWLELTCS